MGEYVTKTGRVLTDEDIEALAREAEEGWEPSYEAIRALEEKVSPWVEFVIDHEGSEVGDMMSAYLAAIDPCVSGQEYGWAYQILINLRDYFIKGIEDGWWDDMLELFDDQYDYMISDLAKRYRPEWLAEHHGKRPSEKAKELPSLTDDPHPTSEST